jgi:uncharacterized protein YkwD
MASMIEMINEERARNGLGPVIQSALLTRQSQNHAATMYRERTLSHSDPGTYGGECVGRGAPNWRAQLDAWLASPTHHNIIMNPNWVHVGGAESTDRIFRVIQFS